MRFFDQVDPGSLERRGGQLWVLALTTILVLATGLALMMYTILFSKPVGLTGRTFTTLFVAYCVLMPLLIGYLIDRQFVIKQLRRKITEEEKHITNLQDEFRSNLLETLPGITHFQDRLAMEHRRASRAEQSFSLVIVGVKPSPCLDAPSDVNLTTVFGDAAKALTRKLRGEDSIYHFGGGVFGILLPRVPTSIANLVVEQLREGMRCAVDPDSGFEFEIQMTNFPDQAASARDMEKAVMDFLSVHRKKNVPERTADLGCGYRLDAVSG
jgi:hypothetical protein